MADTDLSWIQRAADAVEEHAARANAQTIVCESGISPSGPIHLGNLRELITVHFVTEELKARGRRAVHLHSWDDYDRFRKVPGGMDPALAEHIGRPLAAVPDPSGAHDSLASRVIADFNVELAELGIQVEGIRQSVRYPRGDYNASIRVAMERREEIFDILAGYQTPGRHDRPAEERRREYFPFKPYCQACGKDSTTVVGYAGDTVRYTCQCGHAGEMSLADGTEISGKLVWKVDWPMRWAHESVHFEPAGEDHHAPSSSFASGEEIIRKIFQGVRPYGFAYSFVGLTGGSSKMSGSAGGAAVASTALDVLEPAMLRWLYARRTASQSFSIDLSPRAVQRLYDEWDQFLDRSAGPEASQMDRHLRDICLRTSTGEVRGSERRVSFRLLASAADITQANREQIARIVGQHLSSADADDPKLLQSLEPRMTCAINFATRLLPAEERTTVRTEFDSRTWQELDETTRTGVGMLTARLDEHWNLDGLTKLVYGVPKELLGLPQDTRPTPELKRAQRGFFVGLYRLLCDADTGPRLPTLMLSIGRERTHRLLTPML